MVTFLALLRNDFKLFIRDWKALVLLLLIPFPFICLFLFVLAPYLDRTGFVEPFPIALVDRENTAQTRILAKQLDGIELLSKVEKVDEETARKLIADNKVAAAVIIPPDFSESVAAGENKPVTVLGNRAMPLQSYIVKNLMQSAANLVSAGQSAINTIYRYDRSAGLRGKELEARFDESVVQVVVEAIARNEIFNETEAGPGYELSPAEYFTAALLAVFFLFSGMPAMKLLVTERSLGISRRQWGSPVRTWQVLLSKFAVTVVLASVQFVTVFLATSGIFKNYWGAPAGKILLLFAAVLFAAGAWSVFVSAVSKTPASADAVGNLGILLMAVAGGSIYPLSTMPGFMETVSRFTITRWSMEGFMALFSGNDRVDILPDVRALLLIGLALLAASMAVHGFRRRLL